MNIITAYSTKKSANEAVEDLKAQWIDDGCWDLADTEGFEEHRDELQAFEDKIKSCNFYSDDELVEALIYTIDNAYLGELLDIVCLIFPNSLPAYIRRDGRIDANTPNHIYYPKDNDPIGEALINQAKEKILMHAWRGR